MTHSPWIKEILLRRYKRFLADIDPVYSETLKKVHDGGIEILVYRAQVSEKNITLDCPLPYRLA
jgi:DNA-binding sugar fermentation-stimulating protein